MSRPTDWSEREACALPGKHAHLAESWRPRHRGSVGPGTLQAKMSTYPNPAPRRFAELRASEVPISCSERSLLIQPIASIEQHGPHLPLATDLMVCEASAEAAVSQAKATLAAEVADLKKSLEAESDALADRIADKILQGRAA